MKNLRNQKTSKKAISINTPRKIFISIVSLYKIKAEYKRGHST